MTDLVLKLDLPSSRSSESFFKVLDLLLQFNNLTLLLVEQVGEVQVPGSSLEVLGGVFNPSSEETIEFMFEEQEALVELATLIALDEDGA